MGGLDHETGTTRSAKTTRRRALNAAGSVDEAPERRRAKLRGLAYANCRLREHLEGRADLAGAAAGGQDPAILDAHLTEHPAKVRAAVVDAHGRDNVGLGPEHVLDQRAHVAGVGAGCRKPGR